MMPQPVHQSVQAASSKQPIPQHVLDRLESEWKQMRDSSAPQPATQR